MEDKKIYMKNTKGVAKIRLHIFLEEDVWEELEIFSKKKNISKNMIVHKATKAYMEAGTKFNIKTDKSSCSTRKEYIEQAIKWYFESGTYEREN